MLSAPRSPSPLRHPLLPLLLLLLLNAAIAAGNVAPAGTFPATIATLAVASAVAAAPSDCALNGYWRRGRCTCDPGWRGLECGQLDLQPVPSLEVAGYWNESQASWGASPLLDARRVAMPDPDGGISLYVALFSGGCGLSSWQQNSYVARLSNSSSKGLNGTLSLEEVMLPPEAHNPEVLVHGGNISIVVYGGCGSKPKICNASRPGPSFPAPLPSGDCGSGSRFTRPYPADDSEPWHRSQLEFILSNASAAPYWWEGCSLHNTNPSPLMLANGTVLMSVTSNCKRPAGSVSGEYTLVGRAESFDSPFVIDASGEPVFGTRNSTEHSEDGYLYKNARGFHILAHGMNVYAINSGRHAWSEDGVAWESAAEPAYGPVVALSGGGEEVLIRRERPKLVLDEQGHPTYLINGVQRAQDILGAGDMSHTLVQPVRRTSP